MKAHNIFRLIDDMASGRTIATGTQSPFALPAALKVNGKTFTAKVDWSATLDADAVKINPFTNASNQRQEIGSFQITFEAGNGFEGFTSRVSFGTLAEAVTRGDKAEFVVRESKGKTPNAAGEYPVYYNIEPAKPSAFSSETANKVKQMLLTIAGVKTPELESA